MVLLTGVGLMMVRGASLAAIETKDEFLEKSDLNPNLSHK